MADRRVRLKDLGIEFNVPAGVSDLQVENKIRGFYNKPPMTSEDESVFAKKAETDTDNHLGTWAVNSLKGMSNFFLSTPQIAGSSIQEFGELMDNDITAEQASKGIGIILDDTVPLKYKAESFIPGMLQSRQMMNYLADRTNIDEAIVDVGERITDANREFIEDHGFDRPESGGNAIAYDIGSSFASVGASIGMGAVTRNPAAVGTAFGVMQKAGIYQEAREKGKTPEEASVTSDIAGLLEGGLEAIGVNMFINKIKGKAFLMRTMMRAGEEALQEGSQTLGEAGVTNIAGLRRQSIAEITKEVGYSALLGMITGTGVGGVYTHLENKGIVGQFREAGYNDEQAKAVITKIFNKQQERLKGPVLNELNNEVFPGESEEQLIAGSLVGASNEYLEDVVDHLELTEQGVEGVGGRELSREEAAYLDTARGLLEGPAVEGKTEEGGIEAFHGTFADFESFEQQGDRGSESVDMGFHFGSEEQAKKVLENRKKVEEEDRVGLSTARGIDTSKPTIKKVKLDIKNLLRLEEERGGNWSPNDVIRKIRNKIDAGESIQGLSEEDIEAMDNDEVMQDGENILDVEDVKTQASLLQKWLNKRGYDGIVYANKFEGGGDSYIAFNPKQIKGAQDAETTDRGAGTEQVQDKATKATAKAAARQTTREVNRLTRSIAILETEGKKRTKEGKSVKSVEAKLVRLQSELSYQESIAAEIATDDIADMFAGSNEISFLEGEIKTIQAESEKAGKKKEQVKSEEAKGKLKEKIKELKEKQKERLTAQKERFQEKMKEERQARKELNEQWRKKTKDVQKLKDILSKYVRKFLPPSERGKMITTVSKVKTEYQLAKALMKVNQLAINKMKKDTIKGIKNKLKKTKFVKARKGKFTPAGQRVLDAFRKAIRMKKADLATMVSRGLSDDLDKIPTAQEALEINVATLIANMEDMDIQGLTKLSGMIEGIINTSRQERLAQIAEVMIRQEEVTENAKKTIIGSMFNRIKKTSRFRDFQEKLSTKTHGVGQSLWGWNNLVTLLGFNSDDDARAQFEEDMRVSDEETAQKGLFDTWMSDITSTALKVFGLKNEAALKRKFNRDNKVVSLGTVTLLNGDEVDLRFSRAEARKRYMEMLDPSLSDTIFSKDGMGYTEEIKRKIADFLTLQDKAFVFAQLDLYRRFYEPVNEVYSRIMGRDLPFNEFYSPIKRRGFKVGSNISEFLHEVKYRTGLDPKGIKDRTKSELELEQNGDVNVLVRHITELTHYMAFIDKIRQIRGVMRDASFVEAVGKHSNSKLLHTMEKHVEKFIRDGVDKSQNFDWLDKLRVNLTRATLMAKPSQTIKQLVSTVTFLDDTGIGHFSKGMMAWVTNPKKVYDILSQSVELKNRGWGPTRDLKDLMRSQEYQAFAKKPNFLNSMMFFTTFGDKAAIYLGGYGVYLKTLEKTGSKEQAMTAFERSFNESQQSANLSQLSLFQSGNSFTKLMTMYMSSPNQYLRKEYMAARKLFKGKGYGNVAKNVKTLAIYHFLLPQLWQLVSNFGKWDPKEQTRAAILGSLNGIFFFNDIIESALNVALGIKNFSVVNPVTDALLDYSKALGKIDFDDIYWEDIADAAGLMLETTSAVTGGFSVKRLFQIYDGFTDLGDDETRKGIGKILGFSSYMLDNEEDDYLY